jgi:hypothetical protein
VLKGAQAAVDASEVPDTRGARYLPDKAYAAGFNVEPGPHDVAVAFSDGTLREFKQVECRAGRLNLLEAVNLK